jgi:hypothetical protein
MARWSHRIEEPFVGIVQTALRSRKVLRGHTRTAKVQKESYEYIVVGDRGLPAACGLRPQEVLNGVGIPALLNEHIAQALDRGHEIRVVLAECAREPLTAKPCLGEARLSPTELDFYTIQFGELGTNRP